MKIPYQKTREFSTAELPGVLCEPPLVFEFIAAPSFEVMRDLSLWMKAPDWTETRRLAAVLIRSITVPDGTRYELGTPDSISDLARQTEQTFIANLLNGWQTRITLERIDTLKKTKEPWPPSPAGAVKTVI